MSGVIKRMPALTALADARRVYTGAGGITPPHVKPPASNLPPRNCYTRAQFLAEILHGNRGMKWLQREISRKHIREFTHGLISHAEAMNFLAKRK